ncbi:T9SS type A sorting domain-containing protein [Neolewinella antarctica]|uniref:Secretion system C-terminal sorting domain-containing protein n=1 Tax=Neolewinella antarctica TaxID=442734 RepID=A0ABX0XC85_9BACT|nr:T9SS type A sorting domain-containing protein [Neolewinella antarctica]NJC26888.1 hypothetical protein [Neolewinella antarctica]
MQLFYRFSLTLLCLAFLVPATGQTIVPIAGGSDPNDPTDIFPIIQGDTLANGDRKDNNTIYTLENGKTYIISQEIVNKLDWPLQIQAADLSNTEMKPKIRRIPNAAGDYRRVFWPEGDMTLRNIWVVSGEKDGGAQHDWGLIRLFGENSRVVVDNCIIEKDRGGFLQVRANGIRCFVTNSILRNGGNRRILQGNGRGIDARDFFFDSLVVKQTIIHNIQDRVFRSQGAVFPHNYIEFDHNTVFNQVGRHGTFQFGRAKEVKVTNNMLSNPLMLGTSPIYTDEQSQPDGDEHKIFTIDTLFADSELEFAGNNIFYTQDVLDYWASNDSVSQPDVYSKLILDRLGESADTTYSQEVVEFEAVPMSILQYVKDLYADPTSTTMFDFIVEDVSLAGTPFDRGNIFDFSTFSPCYANTAASATGATDGGAIGATNFCDNLSTDTYAPQIALELGLKATPNPTNASTIISYELIKGGRVAIAIYDLSGKLVSTPFDGVQQAGIQQVEFTQLANLPSGMYFANLLTEEGRMVTRIVKN